MNADKFSSRAKELVSGEKAAAYGPPQRNLAMQDILQLAVLECYQMRIGDGKAPLAPGVLSSIQNIQLKFARIFGGDTISEDTQVDLFGYARTLVTCEEAGQRDSAPNTLRARVNTILAAGYTAPSEVRTATKVPKP